MQGALPPLLDMSAPLEAPPPPCDLHNLALARILQLVQWASTAEGQQLMHPVSREGAGEDAVRTVVEVLKGPGGTTLRVQ